MKEIKVGDLDLTGALVELMHTEPDTAEPILLKMLGDPQVDQLLAEYSQKALPAPVDARLALRDDLWSPFVLVEYLCRQNKR